CRVQNGSMWAPRHLALLNHVFELLSISQRVHRPPEALVLISHKRILLDQPIERLEHELFAVPDMLKNLVTEHEVTAVDPHVGLLAVAETANRAMLIEFGEMKVERRADRHEAANLVAFSEPINHIR